jgi:hypothetical protein
MCTAIPSRQFFYGRSKVNQIFGCDKPVTDVSLIGAPTFLTANSSGTTISFTGEAPDSAASNTAWSFGTNQTTTSTTSVTTNILDNSTLASTLSSPIPFGPNNSVATSNNIDFDLGHKLTLANTWDGNIEDVSLKSASVTSDIPGLTLAADCASAIAPYVCNGTITRSSLMVDNNLKLKWLWSAFDQGSYFLDITPETTIESGTTTLRSLTFNATLPIQTAGNVSIQAGNGADIAGSTNAVRYQHGIAISSQSTPLSPIIGLTFIDTNNSVRPYLRRIVVDRTNPPSSGTSGINQSASVLEQSIANSRDFGVRSLPNGSWAVVGVVATASTDDVLFNYVTDSNTAPAITTTVQLTNFSASDQASDVSITAPFTDGSATRMGVAYVRKNSTSSTTYQINVTKINPTGANLATVLDDMNYGTTTTGGYSRFELTSGASQTDRLRMNWISENGIGYFYLAYREATNLKILRLRSSYNSGYGSNSGVVAPNVFTSSSPLTNPQAIDLSLGTISGSTVAGIVYRDQNGDCYFQRTDSTLAPSAPLKFSTLSCYNPSIHFNPSTSRFIVTYSEENANTNYDIKVTEIKIGSTDTFTTPVIIVADLSAYTVKMVTDYYAAGNWMAIFYRIFGSQTLKFHGYHVSGR